jgi:nucleotide-binding universal stress UspA family protein
MTAIVVGYDGSDCSRAALATAIDVGRALGDEVHVVSSYEVNRLGGEVSDYAAALRQRAEHVTELARDQAKGLGLEVTTEVIEKRPADALVEAAARVDARVIVVGTHGESPLKGALVGSTPHKLLQIAHRPVLVVPAT